MHQKYITFYRGAARGVCIPELEPHLNFFAGTFEDWLREQPKKVYLERPNLVMGLRLPSRVMGLGLSTDLPVVIKRFGYRFLLHKIISPLTESKALRSFRIAMVLREAGVATPRPLIAWQQGRHGRMTAGYYIAQEIPEALPFRSLLKAPAGEDSNLNSQLIQLAHLVRKMHDAGIFHRDLTLGNFIVASGSDHQEPGIFITDLSRAVHLGRVPLPIRLIDLARINIQDYWPAFFETYCTGHPDWKRYEPLLRSLVWIRRRRMALWKKIKGRFSPEPPSSGHGGKG